MLYSIVARKTASSIAIYTLRVTNYTLAVENYTSTI